MDKKNESFLKNIYLLLYFLCVVSGIFSTSMFAQKNIVLFQINKYLLIAAAIFLVFKMFLENSTYLTMLFDCIFLIFALLSYYYSKNNILFMMILFMLASKNISIESINKCFMMILSISILIILVSSLIGIIPNLVFVRMGGINRNSFGILYPTDFAAYIFYLMCSYVYFRRNKYNRFDTLFLFLVATILLVFTDARFNCIGILLLIVIMQFKKYFFEKFVIKYSWLFPWLFGLGTVLVTVFFDENNLFMSSINNLLSNRLTIVHSMYLNYGLPLFGNYIDQHGFGANSTNFAIYKYEYIDSAYMQLIMLFGITIFIFFLGYLCYLMHRTKDVDLLFLISLILLSGIVEPHMLEIHYNPFFIMLSSLYLSNINKKNEETNDFNKKLSI